MNSAPAVIILAAGQGTRMKSDLPKVLHRLAGRSMIGHVAAACASLSPQRIVVVTAPGQDRVAAELPGAAPALQERALGTGHATSSGLAPLSDLGDDTAVLIVYGDTPLLEAPTLHALHAALGAQGQLVFLGFEPGDPAHYGRMVLSDAGNLERIVEAKDATQAELALTLCYGGLVAARLGLLRRLLPRIDNRNAKAEYYLTDLVALARAEGIRVGISRAPAEDLMPVNSRAELAAAEAAMQRRLRARALSDGVTMSDPETVYFSFDTRLGRDVEIGPNVVFGTGVDIGERVQIRAFCHIEGARIAKGAVIGPFARLRPGAELAEDVHIGNFVEVKNSHLGRGSKANHLAYLGDARIGSGVNIGAGVVTCNYDGFNKHETRIGDRSFVGTNASLVAPVAIAEDAYIGSGSVITKDVGGGALALSRAEQTEIPGWVGRFRARFQNRRNKG